MRQPENASSEELDEDEELFEFFTRTSKKLPLSCN